MDLLQALEHGKVAHFGIPERIINPAISKVFIYADKAVKVYKHEPFFFADLQQFESRKKFYIEDFFWNNAAAPEIYLHLWGVVEKDGTYELVPPGLGQDFIIEMSRIDDSKTLTKLLLNKEFTKEHATLFIDSLVDTLATLTRERHEELAPLFDKGLYEIMLGDIHSMRLWLYDTGGKVSKTDADRCVDAMSRGIEQELYFKQNGSLSAAIDNNSENLLLREGLPSFIDIMPPMPAWRGVDEYSTIARTILDIEVIGGRELGDAARAAYAKYQRQIPPIARLVHELRAVCIQWSYRYSLNQPELAIKFGEAALAKAAELEQLTSI